MEENKNNQFEDRERVSHVSLPFTGSDVTGLTQVLFVCFLQDPVVARRLASVLSHCYGDSPVPAVAPVDVSASTQLGDSWRQSCDKL